MDFDKIQIEVLAFQRKKNHRDRLVWYRNICQFVMDRPTEIKEQKKLTIFS